MALAALVATTLVIGCGPDGPEVVDVQGKITKGGQPVPFVVIHFWPDKGRLSSGRTDAEGNYRLSFSRQIPNGAVLGGHTVYFTMEQGSINQPTNPRDSKYHPEMVEILRTCGTMQSSPIHVEVTPDSEQLDIEIDEFLADDAEE